MTHAVRSHMVRAVLLVAVGTAFTGCAELKGERVIEPVQVRDAVQSDLGVSLVEEQPIVTVASLPDVKGTYVMKTADERLLLVVFDSPEATRQLTGSAQMTTGDLLVVRNVVAVYEHHRERPSRLTRLRSALRRLDRAAG